MVKPHLTALDLVCSTEEAAAIIGVTPERVAQLCDAGILKARKLGRDWLILTESVGNYAETPRKPGPKSKLEKG